MTKEQTLKIAKSVKAIAAATDVLLQVSQENMSEPRIALSISEPAAEIAVANEKLLKVVKEHYEQFV